MEETTRDSPVICENELINIEEYLKKFTVFLKKEVSESNNISNIAINIWKNIKNDFGMRNN